MKDWYGPPIAVANVPGSVYVTKGGDFRGHVEAGSEASLLEYVHDKAKRFEAMARQRFSHWLAAQQRGLQLNTGFSSLSDLISEAAAGKKRNFFPQKVGTTGVVGATNSLWRVGNFPPAGAAGAAAPGGTVPTDATTGSFVFDNPTGGDTTHFVSAFIAASVAGNQLLLYDRIFAVAKTMNSTATEAVTGTPSRYQSTTGGAADSAEGNFLFLECGTVLPATAHNWTVCTYRDQGDVASTLPSLTGNSGNIVNRLDHPTQQWFAPLESGDRGIKALTQMQCSAAVATGAIDFVIGHPIAWIPCPLANIVIPTDGIQSAFQLERIFDDACLAFLEVTKSATGATTYTGQFTTVAG
jgi:hypothetical protein